MVNVPMPEPVAFLVDWPDEPDLGHYFAEEQAPTGRSQPLITTTQAQAYADAVRREALEEAARQCEGRHQPWGNLADDHAADCMSRAAGRIRALIK